MKAVVCTRYGPPEVLEVREVEKPVPRDDEVLIKVRASTVTAGDCEIRAFRFGPLFWLPLRLVFGLARPRKNIFGQEISGEIEAKGKAVKAFREGDAVFASTEMRLGGHAEYVCLKGGQAIAAKPEKLSFEEAAALPMAMEALYFLKKAGLERGEKLLVNGAGGSIGTFAVQLARCWGAEVSAVDSEEKLSMLRTLGAAHVADYAKQGFFNSGETFDLVFDVVNKAPFPEILARLKPKGRYVMATPELGRLLRGAGARRKVLTGLAKYTAEDLGFIKELAEAGKLRPMIDRVFPLEEAAEAHRYVESGSKKGDVVLRIR